MQQEIGITKFLLQMSAFKILRGTIVYTVINVFGSFLPLFATILYSSIIDEKSVALSYLAAKGEVAIICIPMCITILFTLYQYKKEIGISRWADIIYVITFFWLAIAVGLYAYGMKDMSAPKSGLITFSLWFFLWTVISMIFSKYIEDSNILSLKESRANDQDELEAKFLNKG